MQKGTIFLCLVFVPKCCQIIVKVTMLCKKSYFEHIKKSRLKLL